MLCVVAADLTPGSSASAVFAELQNLGCEAHATSSEVLSVAVRGFDTVCSIAGTSVDADIFLTDTTRDSHLRSVWDALELAGVVTQSPLSAVRAAHDRRRVAARLRHGQIPVPDWVSLSSGDMRRGSAAMLALGCPVAVKLPYADAGEGVWLARDPNELFDLMEQHGAEHGLMIQRHVRTPERAIRVCVIGGEARTALERHTNTVVSLAANERAISEAAQRALGLDIAAVDLVVESGNVVVLDVTAYAPLVEHQHHTGENLIGAVAERLISRAFRAMTSRML